METEARTDEDLARAASAGDRAAFADLYERHFDGLHDFASRTLRDPDAAADVVQETFVKAWDQLSKGRVPDSVRAWMYVVARNAAIDEIRRRGREIPDDAGAGDEDRAPSPLATIEAGPAFDPVEEVRARDLEDLVTWSAEALGPRDATLLDLSVRRGLSADELATELGMKKGAVWTALSRLRDSFEESVVTVLMMRSGRRDCERLAALLDEMGADRPTIEVRRAVQAHIKDCEVCDASRRAMVSPSRLLAGFAFVPVPEGLRQRLWDNVAAHTQPEPRAPRRRSRALTAAALALVLGGAGAGAGAALDRSPTPPTDPEVRSAQEIGGRMDGDTLTFSWDRRTDVAAYAVAVTGKPRDLPARKRNLDGDATGYRIRVPVGTWYFHLRTQGRNGTWTSTVNLGPFHRPELPVSGRCDPMDSPPEWDGLVSTAIIDGRNATVRTTAGGAAAGMVAELSSFDFPVEATLAGTRLGAPRQIARSLTFRGRLDARPAPGRLRLELGIAGQDHVFGSCSFRVPAKPPVPAHALETSASPAGGFPMGAAAGGGVGLLLGGLLGLAPIVTGRGARRAAIIEPPTREPPGGGWVPCPKCGGKRTMWRPCEVCHDLGRVRVGTSPEDVPKTGGAPVPEPTDGTGTAQPAQEPPIAQPPAEESPTVACEPCRGRGSVEEVCPRCGGSRFVEMGWGPGSQALCPECRGQRTVRRPCAECGGRGRREMSDLEEKLRWLERWRSEHPGQEPPTA